jgi:hypothetical protein
MATTPVQVDEESLIREFVSQIALPPGVKLNRVEQVLDWTGDEALRIYFDVSMKFGYGRKRIAALTGMQNALTDKIFEAKIEKFPFFELLEVK